MRPSLPVPRVGRCSTCGRQAPGIFKAGSLRECEDQCPRCGVSPWYLDQVGHYAGNIAKMSVADALTELANTDSPGEVEVMFRIEVVGNPPDGRREVLEAAYKRYWLLNYLHDPGPRGAKLSLDDCIREWKKELEGQESLHMYQQLVRAA